MLYINAVQRNSKFEGLYGSGLNENSIEEPNPEVNTSSCTLFNEDSECYQDGK